MPPDAWGSPPDGSDTDALSTRLMDYLRQLPGPPGATHQAEQPLPPAVMKVDQIGRRLGQHFIDGMMAGPKFMGDVMEGRVDPLSREGVEGSTNAAFSTIGGGVLGAEKHAAGAFGGRLFSGGQTLPEILAEHLGVAEEKPQPFIAYHGSPHNFDRFDASQIGTGEGAQSYGHGLYFAENPAVARTYRDRLSKEPNSIAAYEPEPSNNNILAAKSANGDVLGLIGQERGGYRTMGATPEASSLNTVAPSIDEAKELLAQAVAKNQAAKMYQVQINHAPDRFLDWDKPFAEQTPHVQNALRDLKGVQGTGANLHDALEWIYGDKKAAAEALRNRGVAGIRYLDQGSRGVGAGTRNYVVFNDKNIDVLKKYGLAGLVAPAAALGAAQQDGPQ